MRLFYFLLLISFSAYSQIDYGSSAVPCTEADIAAGGTIQCGSLTISGDPIGGWGTNAIDVKVNGDVFINGAIDISGLASAPDAGSFDNFFGVGGPGGGDGGQSNGGNSTGTPGEPYDAIGASGGNGGKNNVCGSGGGGGGFFGAGVKGTDCTLFGGTGGAAFANLFVSAFRGGFGGGAGGTGLNTTNSGGGGGGGAIRIRAKGNVTISANIDAHGGAGGANTSDGGGGGGGSGGLVWIQALGNIDNNANIIVIGGSGGASATGGAGGDGAPGAVRLEDLDGNITGTGIIPGTALGAGLSLKSDISCGVVSKPEEKTNLFFQMMLGFFVVLFLSKILSRFKNLKFFPKPQT